MMGFDSYVFNLIEVRQLLLDSGHAAESHCSYNSILVCEKVLREEDGVLSLIRLVDLFQFKRKPDVPIDKQAVPITILVRGHFRPGDLSEYSLQLKAVRPDGEAKNLGDPVVLKLSEIETKVPQAPRGFSLIIQISTVPKEEGTHYLALEINGEEVARAHSTLLEQAADAEADQ